MYTICITGHDNDDDDNILTRGRQRRGFVNVVGYKQ